MSASSSRDRVHFETTLYSKDKKDKTRVWTIQVVELCSAGSAPKKVVIRKSYGILDMKQTTVETIIKAGKNVGKSNETTLIQQGISEAQAIVQKQRDAGYVTNVSDIVQHSDVFLPMLASDYNKHGKKIQFPCMVQPKLDGVRLVFGKKNGRVIMKTRTGKDVNFLDHIKDEMEVFIPEGVFLDGEIFSETKTFEEISGNFRKEEATDLDMKFYVFDCFDINSPSFTFEQRIQWLYEFFLLHKFHHTIQVETREIQSVDDVSIAHNAYVESGKEGLILRNKKGVYELNTRSKNLQKYKTFHTEEFPIIGVQSAGGRDEGTAILILDRGEGKFFKARPKGTLAHRKEIFTNRQEYLGKLATIQYFEKTAEGSIRFPICIAIRDYE
jgi:DNA ligase 1